MSAYKVTSSDTVLAVVGYATKGPIGEPTLVTSRSDFNEKFGTTVIGSPFAALASYRAFNQGNKVIFYRVATLTGDYAATSAEVIVKNVAPETYATMGLDLGAEPIAGLTDATEYSVDITIDGGTTVNAAFTTTGITMAVADFKTAIDAALVTEGSGATAVLSVDTITITSGTNGVLGSVLIEAGTTGTSLIGEGTATVATVAAVAGTDSGALTDNIQIKAIEKGSSTNLLSVVKSSRDNPVTAATVHKIEVYYNEVLKETFDNVSLTIADTDHFSKVVNATSDNGGSSYINFDTDDNAADPLVDEFQNGTYVLGTGTDVFEIADLDDFTAYDHVIGLDGYDSAAVDSANEELFVTALSVNGDLGNMEEYDYHILITPDMPEVLVQDAAIILASFRKDFIYIVDSPFGLLYDEVTEWHNGLGAHGRTTALDSSYGILYWSWLKSYNSDTKEYVWCPPSVFVAEKLMEVDRLYGPWAAPAGDLRGKITASDYEHSPSFIQREMLYGDFNAVNPIVNFVSKGLEVYGQKTLLRENSSLNRINVRRMIIFAKKLIKKALESIIFEPHNPDSWRKASNLVTAILEPIRQAVGIDQYSVIIDDTVNTPDVIAQNIMKGTIKIIPMNTIEIIEITMQVHKSGATLDEYSW
jgi:hypothetical protein